MPLIAPERPVLPLPNQPTLQGLAVWSSALVKQLIELIGQIGLRTNRTLLRDGSEAMEGALKLPGDPTEDAHAATKKYVDDTVADAMAFRGALVRKSSTQSIPHNTITALTWDTAVYDTSSIFSGSVPTRLTVPNGVSYVRVGFAVEWAEPGSTSGIRAHGVLKNGNIFPGAVAVTTDPALHTAARAVAFSPVVPVSPGDYFELSVSQNSGSALSVSSSERTWFALEIVQ